MVSPAVTSQTVGVVLFKVTGSPEVDVAINWVNGPPKNLDATGLKVIVCATRTKRSDRVTGVAAAQRSSPA